MQVEALQERELLEQLSRTEYPGSFPDLASVAAAAGPALLQGGGALDRELLEPGGSLRLLDLLAEAFRNEPASDAGRKPQMTGMFHGFREGGYARKVFSPDAVVKTLELAKVFYGSAPNVLRLHVRSDAQLIIVGDTHGQLEDVLWMFFKYGPPSARNQYLFDGDIVDRGGHALEILLLLLALKRDDENCVHILRGNHEDAQTCSTYGFKNEIQSKFGQAGGDAAIMKTCIYQVFPHLPLAAVVSDAHGQFSLCVVHGGIPVGCPGQRGPVTLAGELSQVNRCQPTVQLNQTKMDFSDHVLFNVLWADPLKPGESANGSSGRGHSFSERDTLDFCKANGVHCVVRAHQPPEDRRGFQHHHSGRCITVFSASNYCGNLGNRGGVLICSGQGMASHGAQPAEHVAPPWRQLCELFRAHSVLRAAQHERVQVAKQVEGAGNGGSPHEQQKQNASAVQQVEHYVVEQMVKQKERLFSQFCSMDTANSSVLPLARWAETMAKALPDAPPVWSDLISVWGLSDPVDYVEFLHRFQIVPEMRSGSGATHVDAFQAMEQLQVSITDTHAEKLLREIDQDMSGTVDLAEFRHFLVHWGVDVPEWQTAAIFETLMVSLNRNPCVDDVLTAIALVSHREKEAHNKYGAYADAAQTIGDEIKRSGMSHVDFFQRWDADRSGFLSASELEQALIEGLPDIGRQFTQQQIQALVGFMDTLGVENGRVSLIEFLRAVGPRRLARDLSAALLGEVLRPVFFYKHVLESIFQRFDPASTNTVSAAQFVRGLEEMNRQLAREGSQALSECQLRAVSEIASGGSGSVQYRSFLGSLRLVDTVKRSKLMKAAQTGLLAAMGAC